MSAIERDYAEYAADLDALVHPEHKDLLIYWTERKGERIAPLRSQFDPLDFHELLPRIAIIEVVDGEPEPRFRYRLAGTEIVARGGRDPTGKFFEELYEGSYLETATETYRGLIASGVPHFSRRVFPIGDGVSDLRYDRLILPFTSDGTVIDQFVLLIVVIEQTGSPVQQGSFKSYGGG